MDHWSLSSIPYDAQVPNLKEFNPLAWLQCPNMSSFRFPFWRESIHPQSTPSPPLFWTQLLSLKSYQWEKNFRLYIKEGEVDETFHPAGEWSLYKECSLLPSWVGQDTKSRSPGLFDRIGKASFPELTGILVLSLQWWFEQNKIWSLLSPVPSLTYARMDRKFGTISNKTLTTFLSGEFFLFELRYTVLLLLFSY